MNGSPDRGSKPGSNRRRRLLETSLSSALMRAALVAGGAGALLTPIAEAQLSCTTSGDTQTCSGAPGGGAWFNSTPANTYPNNLVITNVTGPIVPSGFVTQMGLGRSTNDARDLTVTLDKGVNFTANALNFSGIGTDLIGRGAVIAYDTRTNGAVQADVVINNAATITYQRSFSAPTRQEYFGFPSDAVTGIEDNITKVNTALALGARLDEMIKNGELNYSPISFLIFPGLEDPFILPDVKLALAANCVIRPGYQGEYEVKPADPNKPPPAAGIFKFFGDLCWIVPPPDSAETFRLQAAQYIDLAHERIDYLLNSPRPEEAPSFWNAAVYGQATGINAASGDVRIDNSGAIITRGDFTHGVMGRSETFWNNFGGASGTVNVANGASIDTFGDSSIGIVAVSQGAGSDEDATGDAGAVGVSGSGNIHTRGTTAYGIYAAALGGPSFNNDGDRLSGDGAAVTVDYSGDIVTEKIDAFGVYALSKGGVGGNGKGASTHSSEAGGIGGNSATVTVTLGKDGSITTTGARATGIYASSVGGDGGRGGSGNDVRDASRGGAGGNGGKVVITNNGEVRTAGVDAYGVFANSFAGAGGLGGDGDSVFRGRGGRGGEAGDADTVDVTNKGLVLTRGKGAFGIFAQSVGGVAGNGGGSSGAFTSNAGDGGSRESGRCIATGICGDGAKVTVINAATGVVDTGGDYGHAIFAQSVGGGGGVGGDAGGWFSVSGGDGGAAGFGGEVVVSNLGRLQTTGARSSAVFAQSIGGGGGSGGDASGNGQNISIVIGGDGGKGGEGGKVTVTNAANAVILTAGERSDGIFAQSVGGGGGAGGDARAFTIGGFAVPIAIGGQGGGGGNAGDLVKIENAGRIDVSGDFSTGIFAQSIGGGGGVGGGAYSLGIAVSDIVTVSTGIAIGGGGGAGGAGKGVEIDNSGIIITRDFNSMGIVGQSVGGGGGAGGSSMARSLAVNIEKGVAVGFSLAIGGDGGDGGAAGKVDIDNTATGSVMTFGDMSGGILAQSIGGGGGFGGDASAASETVAGGDSSEVKVTLSIGGDGGKGGDGALAQVVNRGSIITLGDLASGITAQSIGGGGGFGGEGTEGDLFEDLGIPDLPSIDDTHEEDTSKAERDRAKTRFGNLQQTSKTQNPRNNESFGRTSKSGKKGGKSGSLGVNFGIGGQGGDGGNGKSVDVKNYGEILTGGFMSAGVFAQSVGGGGGAGGLGEANSSGDLGLGAGWGGDGASGGDGGEVLVLNQGDITTMGAMGFGIFAQSIGGGGGLGGIGQGEGEDPQNFQLNIGGDGGRGGVGGHVRVDQTGNIVTLGDNAVGILGQSVGGGGGIGGSAKQGTFLSVSIGGNGGDGGDLDPSNDFIEDKRDHGGLVEVYASGRVTTEGDHAHGVFAQSVGGGGGAALGVDTSTYVFTTDSFGGLSIDTGLTLGVGNYSDGGAGGIGGNGGEVKVGTSGLITTLGKGSHGIVAQSIGGGGGMGGTGGASFPAAIGIAGSTGDLGHGGKITVTHTGSIHALGQDAVGIWAQSLGRSTIQVGSPPFVIPLELSIGRGDDITINLNNGEIIGGSGDAGAGVFISGGKTNTLTNLGGRISALSGNAIVATDGDDTVINRGLIVGNVGLGGGLNSFRNETAGRFEPGKGVFVGATGSIQNLGIVSPFGDNAAGVSQFVGAFSQGATGDLRMNLNMGGISDRIDVTGAASLSGKLSPITGNVDTLKPGTWTTMVNATGGFGTSNISIDHMDTLVIDWQTRVQGNALQAGIAKIDFDLDGLAKEQSQLAGHIQDIWAAGAPADLDAVLNQLAYGKDMGAYKGLLDAIHPYSAFSQGQHSMVAGASHLAGLQSCPEGAGWSNPLHETECTWIKQSISRSDQEARAGDPGYRDNVTRLQAGQQFDLGGWFGGYSIGYETGSFDIGNDVAGTSDGGFIGAVGKYEKGAWLGSAAVDVAYSTAERRRKTGFPTVMIAESSNDTLQFSGRLRGAYLMEWGDWYVRPALDLDGYHVRTGGFAETGAGVFNMIMADREETFGAATLSVTGGVTSRWAGALWHPYIEASVTQNSEDSFDLSGRLQGAPAGVSDFTVSSALPETLVGGKLGLEAFFPYGSLRAEFEQREGDDGYKNYTGSLKMRFGF